MDSGIGVLQLKSLLTDEEILGSDNPISAAEQLAAMKNAEESEDLVAAKMLEQEKQQDLEEFQDLPIQSVVTDLVSSVGSKLRKIEIFALNYSLKHFDASFLTAQATQQSDTLDDSCNALLDQFDDDNAESEFLPLVSAEQNEMEVEEFPARMQGKPGLKF